MPKPTIAIPAVLPEEIEQLTELRQSVRRVHKSVPAHSPIRKTSAELSSRLHQLHRRGVPLHTLAEIVGLSHQAVRIRVRSADGTASTPRGAGGLLSTGMHGAPMLTEPVPGVVLVADAGKHRRLHIFDPPEDAGPTYLSMIPSIPLLERQGDVVSWMETESTSTPSYDSPTASRLRVPPAVYLPRAMVDSVLVPLTTDGTRESRPGDAARDADSTPED